LLILDDFSITALGQSESGGSALQGTVLDPSGKVITGAGVQITRKETGFTRAVTSDAAGRFQASALPVGLYSIEITSPGFGIHKVDDVRLEVGETISIPIALQIEAVQQEVSVTEAPERIDTENAAAAWFPPRWFPWSGSLKWICGS
jgi:hypothetical protein